MTLNPSQLSWLNSAVPYAQSVSAQTGLDPLQVLAQSALESGWGQSAPGNNYFGIKGSGQTLNTTECTGSNCYATTGNFATYNSMGDSFQAFANYVNSKGLAGYATDPNYNSKISSVMNTIKNSGVDLTSAGNTISNIGKGIGSALCGGIDAIPLFGSAISGGLGCDNSSTQSSDQCGTFDYICKLQVWLANSHFWQRIGIGVLALILISMAFILLASQSKTVQNVAKAAL